MRPSALAVTASQPWSSTPQRQPGSVLCRGLLGDRGGEIRVSGSPARFVCVCDREQHLALHAAHPPQLVRSCCCILVHVPIRKLCSASYRHCRSVPWSETAEQGVASAKAGTHGSVSSR